MVMARLPHEGPDPPDSGDRSRGDRAGDERDDRDDAAPTLPAWGPAWRYGCLVALAAMTVAGNTGAAFAPYLAVEHPALLVALAPYGSHVLLVLDRIGPLGIALAFARRALGLGTYYVVGAVYGEGAIEWIARRSSRVGRFAAWCRTVLGREGVALLVLFPVPALTLLVAVAHPPRGPEGWRRRTVAAAAAALALGQGAQLLVLAWLAERFRPLTVAILAFLRAHQLETTLAFVGLVVTRLAVEIAVRRWRRRAS